MTEQILWWFPRGHRQQRGYLVDGVRVLETAITRRAAEKKYPDATIAYDRDGLYRHRETLERAGVLPRIGR